MEESQQRQQHRYRAPQHSPNKKMRPSGPTDHQPHPYRSSSPSPASRMFSARDNSHYDRNHHSSNSNHSRSSFQHHHRHHHHHHSRNKHRRDSGDRHPQRHSHQPQHHRRRPDHHQDQHLPFGSNNSTARSHSPSFRRPQHQQPTQRQSPVDRKSRDFREGSSSSHRRSSEPSTDYQSSILNEGGSNLKHVEKNIDNSMHPKLLNHRIGLQQDQSFHRSRSNSHTAPTHSADTLMPDPAEVSATDSSFSQASPLVMPLVVANSGVASSVSSVGSASGQYHHSTVLKTTTTTTSVNIPQHIQASVLQQPDAIRASPLADRQAPEEEEDVVETKSPSQEEEPAALAVNPSRPSDKPKHDDSLFNDEKKEEENEDSFVQVEAATSSVAMPMEKRKKDVPENISKSAASAKDHTTEAVTTASPSKTKAEKPAEEKKEDEGELSDSDESTGGNPKSYYSHLPPGQVDKVQIGTRVAVYWSGDDCYYEAVVRKERPHKKKRFFLRYEDGDKEWINFKKVNFFIISGGKEMFSHDDWVNDDDWVSGAVTTVGDSDESHVSEEASMGPSKKEAAANDEILSESNANPKQTKKTQSKKQLEQTKGDSDESHASEEASTGPSKKEAAANDSTTNDETLSESNANLNETKKTQSKKQLEQTKSFSDGEPSDDENNDVKSVSAPDQPKSEAELWQELYAQFGDVRSSSRSRIIEQAGSESVASPAKKQKAEEKSVSEKEPKSKYVDSEKKKSSGEKKRKKKLAPEETNDSPVKKIKITKVKISLKKRPVEASSPNGKMKDGNVPASEERRKKKKRKKQAESSDDSESEPNEKSGASESTAATSCPNMQQPAANATTSSCGTAACGLDAEAKRKKEEARTLTPAEIAAILGEETPCASSNNWVRRSARMPSRCALNSPKVKQLIHNLTTNHPDMVVLKMKKYVPDSATPQVVINSVLDALEENTNCQSLYIQNYNEGMKDEEMLRLMKILQMPTCNIWCLNIGETYKVKRRTWKKFAKGLRHTKITHMYASEHTISPELKDYIRERIRRNRSKHNMHVDPENLDTIVKCTHCWWNPINAKVLRPYLHAKGYAHILNDKEAQGARGAAKDAEKHI
eukprot:CAMPEP_0172471198 /NCGR_PEP_ID=MMETSP1065-20121228/67694_1 /TAXON_ID=265537 /ORGANISM="Amphiprora paludosa, Strain CCMP125" /LENGTH=1100 /DNA_ID=CAMNT_0013229291 /DNA_START=10 /DNA_END=3312 /DNA_ORIENTATION=-